MQYDIVKFLVTAMCVRENACSEVTADNRPDADTGFFLLEETRNIAYFGTPYAVRPVYRLVVAITFSVCVNISSQFRNEQFTKLSYFSCTILLLPQTSEICGYPEQGS